MDNKIKLLTETIRLLLDAMQEPVNETNYADRLEATKDITEAAEDMLRQFK